MRKRIIIFLIALSCIPAQGLAMNKSITRVEDPVVISGKELDVFLGSDPESLAVMIYKDGQFKPIPFQIDQKHEDGTWAFTNGKDAKPDADPNLDANDELVFMVNDLGDKALLKDLPHKVKARMELTVVDPIDSKKGWAYLFMFTKDPSRSTLDYTEFSVDKEYITIITKHSTGKKNTFFRWPKNSIIFDESRYFQPNGDLGPDVFDCMKMRGKINLKYLPTFNIALDRWLKGDLVGWIDGPVRFMGKVTIHLKFFFIKWGINAVCIETFYRNRVLVDASLSTPINIADLKEQSSLLQDNSDFLTYLDLSSITLDHRVNVYTQSFPPSSMIRLDGVTNHDEEQLLLNNANKNTDWIVGYSSVSTFLGRMFFPEKWKELKRTLYVNEDLNSWKKPENEKGELGVGWKFSAPNDPSVFADIASGSLKIHVYMLDKGFQPSMEKPLLNIHDQPISILCKKL